MGEPGQTNQLRVIGILLAVAAVGGIVAFALLQPAPSAPLPPLPMAAATASPGPAEAPLLATAPAAAANMPADTAPGPVTAASTDDAPAWESTIDGILRSNVSESQMAQMLINILPTLPEDGQIEAANHIANLLPDSEYNSVRPLLLNPSLPESVLSVFFTDLMNRDDSTKLNAFLDIAQIPNHPFQSEAQSDLQIYLGEDYGNDWAKIRSGIAQYLKTANEQ
jgi:hypothetical protein